jgi:hypothetical protein
MWVRRRQRIALHRPAHRLGQVAVTLGPSSQLCATHASANRLHALCTLALAAQQWRPLSGCRLCCLVEGSMKCSCSEPILWLRHDHTESVLTSHNAHRWSKCTERVTFTVRGPATAAAAGDFAATSVCPAATAEALSTGKRISVWNCGAALPGSPTKSEPSAARPVFGCKAPACSA